VAPLHPEDHTRVNPFDEFRMIAPDAPVIAVELREDRRD